MRIDLIVTDSKEWLLAQPLTEMGVAIFTTGPYMDMSIHAGTPMAPKVIDGVVTWKVPLGELASLRS